MKMNSRQSVIVLCGAVVLASVGCSSMKTPATADVAVSKAAVDNAASAGGAELANKDYELASDLANQAQADAKLAQAKAASAKAQAASAALDDDIRILREELQRARK